MERAPRDRWLHTAAVALLGAAFALIFFRTAWACEDAFIDFRVVESFRLGHGLTWNPGERVWNFTSPLWTLLLVPLSLLLGSEYSAALTLSFACGVAVLVGFARLARRASALAAVLGFLLASQTLASWSSGGLENPLLHVLVTLQLLAARAAISGEDPRRAWLAMSLCTGLLAVTRLDALLLAVPCWMLVLGSSAAPVITRERLRTLCLGLLPFLAWELFALVYFGDLVPNSARAKLPEGYGFGFMAPFGLKFLADSVRWDSSLLVAPVVAITLGVATRPRELGVAAGCALALCVAYFAAVGGDYMAGRLLSPWLILFGGLIVLALEVPAASDRVSSLRRVALSALTACALLSAYEQAVARVWAIDYSRGLVPRGAHIADERAFYYRFTGLRPVLAQGAVEHPWMQSARRAWSSDVARVFVKGNVGLFGWALADRGYVVDVLALGSPFLARIPACPSRRPGHWERPFPRGYFASELAGVDHLAHPLLGALWRDMRSIARGELWSAERWLAIARVLRRSYPRQALLQALQAGGVEEPRPLRSGSLATPCGRRVKGDGSETYVVEHHAGERNMKLLLLP